MTENTVETVELTEEEILNSIVTDEALEAAAEAETRSYTYQTSARNRCCR